MQSTKRKILVVEDEWDILRVLQLFLEQADFEVATARDGFQAMEYLLDAANSYPDLIVLDVMMPRMSGLEVLRRVKTNVALASIPVLMLTARDSQSDEEELQDLGADYYHSKPFQHAELVRTIQMIVEEEHQEQTEAQVDFVDAEL